MNDKLKAICLIRHIRLMGLISLIGLATACNPEPDESDLYTATGETAADYINRKAELSAFYSILNVVGLDRNLSAYGEYTCFIPTNSAVEAYINKLYNDTEAKVPHNGLEGNSLDDLLRNDSLCNDIARYHLTNGSIITTIDLGGGSGSVSTMLRIPISSDGTSGRIVLNQSATIVEPDSIVTNGVVHVIDSVIPRNTRLLSEEMERLSEFSIFYEALQLTGLSDSITKTKKDVVYSITDTKDTNGDELYHPDECKIMYTIFAEPDSIMRLHGINNINDLINYANEVYGNAAQWYDYPAEKGISISTGNDYTNRFNTLNMFVAYHILYAGMPEDELVYERSVKWSRTNNTWNFVNGAQPFDYYETMLPNTILKIWQPQPMLAKKSLYINRYLALNTLTDQLGTMGSSAMHTEIRPGVKINRSDDRANGCNSWNIQTFNGYIHSIQDMLVYDELVPKGVLHERLRFDSTTFLVEFINNGIRMSSNPEMKALNGGGSGNRVAFPLNYFDNVVSYTTENRFRYNIKGAYNAWQSDTFQGWGDYDLAIKLPPVPTNTYEFRIFYTPMSHGGMMQFYMGNSSSLQSMMALDIPLDVRIPIDDPRIGSTHFYEEDDLGVATDAALRNRGYMRGLFSYVDHPEYNDGNSTDHNMRSDLRNASLRKIMGRMQLRQSDEHWFRIKNVISDETDLKWQFDYIEFVPIDVVDNDTYSEDWF
ncbi:MAG: fasciclin domain-containing protein [Prevotella sp.]|nr:fasciclin domain-containing protein [Prevotella sp.]